MSFWNDLKSAIHPYCKNHPNVCFGGVFLVFMLCYSLPYVLGQPPRSIHLWRQTDSLSIARYYLEHGLNFFDSGISIYLFKDFTSCKTVGEFPLVYYFVALLWKIFGEHVWIFRVVTLLLFFFGLRSILRVALAVTGELFWSLFIISVLLCSPAIAFYSTNFLPDIHAASFSFIAIGIFYNYWQTQRLQLLYWSLLFFTLAGLIKPTALIPLCVLLSLLVIQCLFPRAKKLWHLFHHTKHAIVGILVLGLLNVAWLFWVYYYNETYGGWFTQNTIYPPWLCTSEEMDRYLSLFRSFLVNQAGISA